MRKKWLAILFGFVMIFSFIISTQSVNAKELHTYGGSIREYGVSDIKEIEFFSARDVYAGVDWYGIGIGMNITMSDGNTIYVDWGHEYEWNYDYEDGGKHVLNNVLWELQEGGHIKLSVDGKTVDDEVIVKNPGTYTVDISTYDLDVKYNKSVKVKAVSNPVSGIGVMNNTTRKIALADLKNDYNGMDTIMRTDVIAYYTDSTSAPLWETIPSDYYSGWTYSDGSASWFVYNTKLYNKKTLDPDLRVHGNQRYRVEYVLGKKLSELTVGKTYPLIIKYMGREVTTYITVTKDKTDNFNYGVSSEKSEQGLSLKTGYKKNYTKAYGDKVFSLGVVKNDDGGALSYKSSDKKVATVSNKGKVTIKGTGVATITVTAAETDEYKEKSMKITVKVTPARQKVKSAKPAKGKKLAVSWKKDSKATGYEIQCSTDKKFKKSIKKKSIANPKKVKWTFSKLKKGQTYYVRVRAYKKAKVNGKSTKLYGEWSSLKKSGKIK